MPPFEKILKIKPEDEHALLQSADMSTKQGRLADAKGFLKTVADVCVDGGLESTMYEAQAQLADAYLDVGRALEARIISEDLGMVDDVVKALEIAARSARQRFDACSLLGRLYIEQGHTAKAVEWFERAAEAPAPTPDASRALLYDLAETLENLGEHGRALAVFVELEAESGGYRDVAHPIERLSKAKAKR